ncbi:OLC1v1009396C1 [Oldenlandia corymbosa var. corymbosa]|uniref:OLC1v1009396C1 n=1 Tax=Oldenlandia corymbosa var. corymbosa TaxID=529605 RepID=A0AAV1DNV0_OLDCO|nr:OLC1v1009396C1 [Oldenlandia corymbosa var. corymbosa]
MTGRKMAGKRENRGGSYGREEEEELMASGFFQSPKFGFDLMQNCDLPPPMKVYAGQEKTIVSPPMNIVYGTYDDDGKKEEKGLNNKDEKYEDEKLELLKALRLSQTRAREAEKKAAALCKEKDDLADFLLRQSMDLFAYKQWVRMMELEVGRVSKQDRGRIKEKSDPDEVNWSEFNDGGAGQSMKWLVAVTAICMSIAGVGIFSLFSSSSYQH